MTGRRQQEEASTQPNPRNLAITAGDTAEGIIITTTMTTRNIIIMVSCRNSACRQGKAKLPSRRNHRRRLASAAGTAGNVRRQYA